MLSIEGTDYSFLEQIINGMSDWVRVIDFDNNIIFLNESMSKAVDSIQTGVKCFEAVGRNEPCENCTSRVAVFSGQRQEKEEIIGSKTFSVASSPIRNDKGEIIAIVEVLRDISSTKLLQKKIIEQNNKLQYSLDIARKLQFSMLPKGLDEENIGFSYVYKPCEALSGDFIDIFKIDSRHIGLYIADVSGHGVPASMLTVFLRTALNKKLLSPALALKELYEAFNISNFEKDLYITVFYAVLDLYTLTLTFSNAGHSVCPIVFNDKKFDVLRSSGIPISNWIDVPEYCDLKIDLLKGDRVFFYSDGITDLRNNNSEHFSEKRLIEHLIKNKSSIDVVLNDILIAACNFADLESTSDITDDITIAMLEIK